MSDFILTMLGLLLGTSIPMVPLPGMGAMMRMPSAAKLRKAVRGVLRLDDEEQANGGATLSVEPEAEDLRRALLAGELSDL